MLAGNCQGEADHARTVPAEVQPGRVLNSENILLRWPTLSRHGEGNSDVSAIMASSMSPPQILCMPKGVDADYNCGGDGRLIILIFLAAHQSQGVWDARDVTKILSRRFQTPAAFDH